MLGVDELLAENLPVTLGGGLLDDDLAVVVGQLEDDELELLGKLEVVEGVYALLRDGSSAGVCQLLATSRDMRARCGIKALSLGLLQPPPAQP